MRLKHISLQIATIATGVTALGGCHSPSFSPPPERAFPARLEGKGESEPQLEDMGLVYDDTIVTESGRTVDFNGQAFVPRYIHTDKSGAGASLDVDVAVVNVVFGINADFTLRVGVPYVQKQLDRPAGASTLNSAGLGDTALLGKYRFYQKTGRGETTEAALIFGLELPTGRDDVRDGGMTLPQPLQPGSGSVDAIIGGAFTRVDGRWLVNADLMAKLNSEANDFRFGTELRADVGGQYRVHPARYKKFDQLTVNLVTELNARWADQSRLAGNQIFDSGGSKLFLTPGVQVIINRYFLLEAAVLIPVAMDLNGDQLEEDLVSIFGLRARF